MSSPAYFGDVNMSLEDQPAAQNDEDADIPKRLMRVKVLYTFDNDNKTNCLARLQDPMPIPVIPIDDSTEIGIIELRTCIQAIIAASPELIHKLEQDYTVYAYDYSEFETPLVGQGMLSRVLAEVSPTPHVPASQSGTMITGRVCKNILGIYAKGLKETLEVKLKLVPVPTKFQSEYEKTMEARSSLQRTSSITSNRGNFEALHNMLTPNFSAPYDPFDDSISQIQSLPGSSTPSLVNFDPSRPESRASIRQPQPQSQSHPHSHSQPQLQPQPHSQFQSQSQPQGSSVTETQPHRQQQQEQQQELLPDMSLFDDSFFEDGPAPKRARLTPADWRGRSSFGGKNDSLRVAASTAASIRGFRTNDNSALNQESIPRAPTPRPFEKSRKQSITQPSGLSRSTLTDSNSLTPRSDISFDDGSPSQAGSSPDIPSSPPVFVQDDFLIPPSSPLLPEFTMHTDSGFQSDIPTDLPIPQSDQITMEEAKIRQEKWRSTLMNNRSKQEWAVFVSAPQQVALPPRSPTQTATRKSLNAISGSQKRSRSRSKKIATSEIAPARTLSPAPEIDHVPHSNGPISAPVTLPKRNPLSKQGQKLPRTKKALPGMRRASTWTANTSDIDVPDSEANILPSIELRNAATPEPQAVEINSSKVRSGSGAVRQRTIKNQLEQAIQAGMPPKYCMNCGNVKTPTWRPYWVRVEYGTGEDVQVGGDTGIHCVEPVSRDEATKRVLTYRIYKQWNNLTKQEKESQMFEQLVLCNSCGDFFRKRRYHRPATMFRNNENSANVLNKVGIDATIDKGDSAETDDQRKIIEADSVSTKLEAALREACRAIGGGVSSSGRSEKLLQQEHAESDKAYESIIEIQPEKTTLMNHDQNTAMGPPAPPAPVSVPVPGSVSVSSVAPASSWADQDALMKLQRAIQQSPIRAAQGSKHAASEMSQTPDPVRRKLFPSPRKDGEFISLDDSIEKKLQNNSSHGDQAKLDVCNSKIASDSSPCPLPTDFQVEVVLTEEAADKENRPPRGFENNDISNLLGCDINELFRTPKKYNGNTPKVEGNGINNGVAASSPLPATTGLTPVADLSQFLNSDSYSPNRLGLSPTWLRTLQQTPGKTSGPTVPSAGFDFDSGFFDNLSSDMPMSSSPGFGGMMSGLGNWDFYEDVTAAVGSGQEQE